MSGYPKNFPYPIEQKAGSTSTPLNPTVIECGVDPSKVLPLYHLGCPTCGEKLETDAGNPEEGTHKLSERFRTHVAEKNHQDLLSLSNGDLQAIVRSNISQT
jgi:hypothetical protein